MSGVRLGDVSGFLERLAPPALAEEWDRSGLLVGDPDGVVNRVLVALDPTRETIDEAIRQRRDLIVTHHPLFLKPLETFNLSDPTAALIALLIKNGIGLISAHTNFDRAAMGVNDFLADALGLLDIKPLLKGERQFKLAVTVPGGREEEIARAMSGAGAGVIGEYADCAFFGPGTGMFTPGKNANPFIGSRGKLTKTAETRLEMNVPKSRLPAVKKALKKAHPYEEPAVDVYPLEDPSTSGALGRIGVLPAPLSLAEFASLAVDKLGAPSARYVGDGAKSVSRVAVCGGSGAFLWRAAKSGGADVLVTGDVRYHDALDAKAAGFALIDAGHGPTEKVALQGFIKALEGFSSETGAKLDVAVFLEGDPFQWL